VRPVALTIAGSDPSGGAGIQADLKIFHQFDVYGEAVITLITVQNTIAFDHVEYLKPALVADQIRVVVADIPPQAAKTGALGNREIIETVADLAAQFEFPLVVDPVMSSKHGGALLSPDAIQALKTQLLPRAALVTPNLAEAEFLTGLPVRDLAGMRAAAERLLAMGARAALIKGGHLTDSAVDVLLESHGFLEFPAPRIETRHTHGTGCTFSAAITALLARGFELTAAIRSAKDYVTEAIRTNPGLGSGSGPLNHHAPVRLPTRSSAVPEE